MNSNMARGSRRLADVRRSSMLMACMEGIVFIVRSFFHNAAPDSNSMRRRRRALGDGEAHPLRFRDEADCRPSRSAQDTFAALARRRGVETLPSPRQIH